MELFHNRYYHIYNRSNNKEVVFRSHDNYLYFLTKYREAFRGYLDTIAYCLMPTHFHFLVKVTSEDMIGLQNSFGKLLSSYTRAINKRYHRHGSLFQRHSKSKLVDNEEYLLALVAYIHQNPVRSKLTETQDEWIYSSYQDYIGRRGGTLPRKEIIFDYCKTIEEFRSFSDRSIQRINPEYWI